MGLLKLSLGYTCEKSHGTSKMSPRICFPFNLTVSPSDRATLSRSHSRYRMCRHQVFYTCPILTKTILSPVAKMNTGNSKCERCNISLKEGCKDRLFFFWRLANVQKCFVAVQLGNQMLFAQHATKHQRQNILILLKKKAEVLIRKTLSMSFFFFIHPSESVTLSLFQDQTHNFSLTKKGKNYLHNTSNSWKGSWVWFWSKEGMRQAQIHTASPGMLQMTPTLTTSSTSPQVLLQHSDFQPQAGNSAL